MSAFNVILAQGNFGKACHLSIAFRHGNDTFPLQQLLHLQLVAFDVTIGPQPIAQADPFRPVRNLSGAVFCLHANELSNACPRMSTAKTAASLDIVTDYCSRKGALGKDAPRLRVLEAVPGYSNLLKLETLNDSSTISQWAQLWLVNCARLKARTLWCCALGVIFSCASLSLWGLDWQAGEGFRSAPCAVPKTGHTQSGFTQIGPDQTGIYFTNHLSDAQAAENQIRLVGSGVALGDVDGDGWCDIYLCRLDGPNVLYRNLGNWRFEDITARAGVACPEQYSTGAVFADVDGDGDLDLLVNALGGGTRLFLNDGQGHFLEATNSGLFRKSGATSMALADVDGDGDLDLYVTNYRTNTIRSTGLSILNINGRRVIRPQDREQYEFTQEGLLLEHGEIDALYLNDGHGNFTPVPWKGGHFLDEDGQALAGGPKDWGLSVMFRDLNGDGAPDIYVCNDFWSPDRVWLNDGHGNFRAAPRLTLRHTSTFSMGIDFADLNRDGYDDFLVLDMLSRDHGRRMRQRAMLGHTFNNIGKIEDRPQVEHNTLFLNRGDGTYAEIAQLSGVEASEWSWGIVFLDVDLDGFEDFLVTTGHAFDTQDSDTEGRINALGPLPSSKISSKLLMYPRLEVAKQAFHNRGDLTFEEAGERWGFNQVGVAHGIALADLDNDGDLDVVVNNLNGAAGIYRNEASAPRVAVRLKGQAPNTRGIGAKIKFLGGPVTQSQEMICGGRYLSGDDPERVFATGTASNGLSIEVSWRDAGRSLIQNVQPNCVYEVAQTQKRIEAPKLPAPTPEKAAALFKDVSEAISHVHSDPLYDDFAVQSLLSRRLSQLGPGISWFDVDGDGREDLLIGAGRGGELAIFFNRGNGRFEKSGAQQFPGKAPDDQTAMVGWAASGDSILLVGTANYETSLTNRSSVGDYQIGAGTISPKQSLPQESSIGPLAAADLDGDTHLDLFVGGRVIPGRYPEAADSKIYRSQGGKFVLDEQNSRPLAKAGLVSGAVFSDLDGDGFPELILACEWGPLKIFRNEHGKFLPWDPPVETKTSSAVGAATLVHLSQLTGWWNGVATGDFDGDGRMDIVASNWGRNTAYEQYVKESLRVYYGDFGGRPGAVIEAVLDAKSGRLLPWRDLDTLATALPWLRERFGTAKAYGDATLEQLLGEHFKSAHELRANWLDSTVFLNRGDHFEARSLPLEAQFAPAFAVCVSDFDGDGHEDIFLSQNFFAVEERTTRYDAGRGLCLKGDGTGNFKPLTGQESGIRIYGEQRGAAFCDYDGDGRVDLAVAQNGAATKLYHNETAQPGLRVRLKGPVGNSAGVGAILRLVNGTGMGPACEIHAGSGYWSQESVVQIFAGAESGSEIWVRWPGGKVVIAEIPKGAKEMAVNMSGGVEVLR